MLREFRFMPANTPMLFPCPACKNEVSAQADACPKCGQPIRSQWEEPARPVNSGTKTAFAVFAGLCLFAALTCFLTGFGQIGAGANQVHTMEAENQGKMRTGDPLDNDTNRKIADSQDREETAHGQFNLVVGSVLLIPAVVLWRMRARRRKP